MKRETLVNLHLKRLHLQLYEKLYHLNMEQGIILFPKMRIRNVNQQRLFG